jgi:Tfp pilus assembly protein FimT
MADQRGISVLELMVSLLILAIATTAGVSNFRSLQRSFAKDSAIKQIEFDIRRAKAEAVSRNVRGIIEIAPDGRNYRVGLDEFPFQSPPAIEVVLARRELPGATSISAADDNLYFGTRGFLTDDVNNPITGTIFFAIDGEEYATGTIYATGVFLLRTYI